MVSNAERLAESKLNYEGKTFTSNNCGEFEVISYSNKRNILIKFKLTGYETNVEVSQIKNGSIKDRMFPEVMGIGVVGDSITKVNGKHTKEYALWRGVLERCYNPKKHLKLPTYIGCSVSDNFKYFPCFEKWCSKQVGFDLTDENSKPFHLDKDLLIKGNKVYSEDTCVFVPQEINNLLTKPTIAVNGYPVGVHYCKAKNTYIAQISRGTVGKGLGSFDTPEEAFHVYKQAKEDHIKDVANKWKDQIDPRVYNALMNYQVEITD